MTEKIEKYIYICFYMIIVTIVSVFIMIIYYMFYIFNAFFSMLLMSVSMLCCVVFIFNVIASMREQKND